MSNLQSFTKLKYLHLSRFNVSNTINLKLTLEKYYGQEYSVSVRWLAAYNELFQRQNARMLPTFGLDVSASCVILVSRASLSETVRSCRETARLLAAVCPSGTLEGCSGCLPAPGRELRGRCGSSSWFHDNDVLGLAGEPGQRRRLFVGLALVVAVPRLVTGVWAVLLIPVMDVNRPRSRVYSEY